MNPPGRRARTKRVRLQKAQMLNRKEIVVSRPENKEDQRAGEVFASGPVVLHPTWYGIIKYCEALGFGEIERLKIQNGLPIIAEEVRKKVNFAKGEGYHEQ